MLENAIEFRTAVYASLGIQKSPEQTVQPEEGVVNVTVIVRNTTRRIANLKELKRGLRGLGDSFSPRARIAFVIAQMETLSFREQVEVMAHTSILVSAHGAGLVGAYFMPAGGIVAEMYTEGFLPCDFGDNMRAAGHTYVHWCMSQHKQYPETGCSPSEAGVNGAYPDGDVYFDESLIPLLVEAISKSVADGARQRR